MPPAFVQPPVVGSVVPLHAHGYPSKRSGDRCARQGLDYTYARYQAAKRPIRWAGETAITVRVVDGSTPDDEQLVRALCRQLHDITGLRLDLGPSLQPDLGRDRLENQTIAVAFLAPDELAAFSHRHPMVLLRHPRGYCRIRVDRRAGCYSSAFVAVPKHPAELPAATALPGLRHQLGHALGLGHARSLHRLMTADPVRAASDFTATEVWALRQLYRSGLATSARARSAR